MTFLKLKLAADAGYSAGKPFTFQVKSRFKKKVNSDEMRPDLTLLVQDVYLEPLVHMCQGHLNCSLALYQPRGTTRDLSTKYNSYNGKTISGILHKCSRRQWLISLSKEYLFIDLCMSSC